MKVKERILHTANNLFYEQGYNNTGINQIIKEASVAKASFYSHFPSKETLAVAYLEDRHNKWMQNLRNIVLDKSSVQEKIIAVFNNLKQKFNKGEFKGCVFINMLSETKNHNSKLYEVIKKNKEEQLIFFESILTDKEQAFLVYMMYEACLTETQLSFDTENIDKTIRILKKQL